MDPDGGNLEVYASGFRNPYGFDFDGQGRLFATSNGPNHRTQPHPDPLHYVVPGGFHGYPRVYIDPEPWSLPTSTETRDDKEWL